MRHYCNQSIRCLSNQPQGAKRKKILERAVLASLVSWRATSDGVASSAALSRLSCSCCRNFLSQGNLSLDLGLSILFSQVCADEFSVDHTFAMLLYKSQKGWVWHRARLTVTVTALDGGYDICQWHITHHWLKTSLSRLAEDTLQDLTCVSHMQPT